MSQDNKETLKSIGPLVVVIILFVIVGKFGMSQISAVTNQVKEAKKTESVLSEKLKILRSASGTSTANALAASSALPDANPSILTVAQLKNLASQDLIILKSIRTNLVNNSTSGLPYVNISMEVSGDQEQLVKFVKDVGTIAPISFVDKMELSEDKGSISSTLTVKSYWAPLPSTIPTVTQSVTALTASEQALLSQITTLSQPILMAMPSATSSGTNPNPFGQ